MTAALRAHWPEYAIEAAGLGVFMVSACLFAALLEHPSSPVRQALPDATLRRACMGVAMGLTAIALIYSRWGRRSGAHFNPAVTVTFWRLGRVAGADALGYAGAQALGAVAGVAVARLVAGPALAHPAVRHVVTVPGPAGAPVAFAAELAIAAGLMLVVLWTSNHPGLARFTGCFAGALVALYIGVEAPLSGMSLNPARTLGSAVHADVWTAWWVYVTAPPLGMLAAATLYTAWPAAPRVGCAKLHHGGTERCIFRCARGAGGGR